VIAPELAPTNDQIARHYDELDPFYRDIWGEHVHHGLWKTGSESPEEAVLALVDRVAEAADIEAGTQVCDVGCGYGATSRRLVERYGAKVLGVTLSKIQLAFANEANGGSPNPAFELVDWLDNGFAAESFDRIVSIECLEHVPDKRRFFAEIRRVLRPGGRAVVTGWLLGPRNGSWAERWILKPICREGHLGGIATSDEYADLARAVGLDVRSVETLGHAVRRTWGVCARRLAGRLVTDPRYVRYLLDSRSGNRGFALTLVRMWLGYRLGAIDYGLFVLHRRG
jgi:tocopherol O-methyltransferase